MVAVAVAVLLDTAAMVVQVVRLLDQMILAVAQVVVVVPMLV
jgi:hypothetical protein